MTDENAAATPSQEATPAQGSPDPKGTEDGKPEGQEEGKKAAESVTLSKGDHDQLQKDAARAVTAQSDADKWKERAQSKSKKHAPEAEAFTDAELADLHREISNRLLSKPEVVEALNKIPIVKDILTSKNPLAILGDKEFIDLDDALDQLEEYFEDNVLNLDILKKELVEDKPESKGDDAKGADTPAPAPANTPDSDDAPNAEKKPESKSRVFKNDGIKSAEDSILAKTKAAMGPPQDK